MSNRARSEVQEKLMLSNYVTPDELASKDSVTDFKLFYRWWTEREFYNDGFSANFLYSEFVLENLQTKLLKGST